MVAIAKIGQLRHVAVLLPERPHLDTDEKENRSVDDARPGRHQAVHADATFKGFARASDESERGHGRAEDRHEKHEGTDTATGKKEVAGWGVPQQATALEAAGKIHTDMAKGFIAAEVTPFDAWLKGTKPRTEGKTHLVQDGDVIHFKFNV